MNLKKTLAAVLSAFMPISSVIPASAAAGKTVAAPAGAPVVAAVAPSVAASVGLAPLAGYRFPGLNEAPISEPGMTVPGTQAAPAASRPAAVQAPVGAPVGLQAAPAAPAPLAAPLAAKAPAAAVLSETGAALASPSQPGAASAAAQSLTLNRLFDLSGRSSVESAEVLGHDALVGAPALSTSLKGSGSARRSSVERSSRRAQEARAQAGSGLVTTALLVAGGLFAAALVFSKDFRALMGRLWNVLLGALGIGVKKAETPEIIAQRIIDQLNAAKPEWNKRVAEASTLVNQLRTQVKGIDAKVKDLDETATALLSDDNPGNDGLATGMLQSKMTLETQNAANKEQLKLAEAGLESIKAERERFFNEYQSKLAKVQAQLSRAKQAEINSKIADLKGGFELGGLKDNEDKLGQIVDEMEAGAAGKLDSAESNPDAVIQKAKDELAKSGVQAEIERRKAEIAAKKKAAEEAKKNAGSGLNAGVAKTYLLLVVEGAVGVYAGLASGALAGVLGVMSLAPALAILGFTAAGSIALKAGVSPKAATPAALLGGLTGLVAGVALGWLLGAVSTSIIAAILLGSSSILGYLLMKGIGEGLKQAVAEIAAKKKVDDEAYRAILQKSIDGAEATIADAEKAKKDGGSSLVGTAALVAAALFTAAMIFSKDFRALMGRLWNVLLGALGMGVKKTETPEIIAQRIIDQLNAAKPEWNKRVADASTLVNGLRTQVKNMDAKVKELDDTATALLSDDNPGNDGLATGMLQSKMTLETQNAANKEQLKLAEAGLESIKAERERFFNEYQSKLAKVQAQLSRAKQAEINSKIADLKGGFEIGGLKDNEDRLGQIVDEMEAGAAGKLDSAESNPDAVIQKAKDELAKSGVQAEIERRKAEIAAKKKAAEEAKKSAGSSLLAIAALIGGFIANMKGKRALGYGLYGFGTTLMLGALTGIVPLIYAGLDALKIKMERKAGRTPDLAGLRNGYLAFAGGSVIAAGLVVASLLSAGYMLPLAVYGILAIAPAVSLAVAGVFHRLSTKQD